MHGFQWFVDWREEIRELTIHYSFRQEGDYQNLRRFPNIKDVST
jgi:hypothetical protein